MRWFILLLPLGLAGCGESEFEAEKRRFEFIKANGASQAELCAQGRRVSQAAIDEGDSYEYKMWKIEADLACNAVLLESLRG